MSSGVAKYLKYKQKAVSKHKVHSPFVFDLICDVLENDEAYYAFPPVNMARELLLKNKGVINVKDLGAGSRVFKSPERKVKEIAKHSLVQQKYGELLFRLVNYFQPQTIIELGTSLGISVAYLAKANSKSKVFTIEGSKEVAKVAASTFSKLKIKNAHQLIGNFDEVLPQLVERLDKVDMVYFDGNHQKEPTLSYFETCLEKAHENTVFIFDDIHWSDEMEEAWEEIKKHESVNLTIDLFQFGLVFFQKSMPKQDFVLKF